MNAGVNSDLVGSLDESLARLGQASESFPNLSRAYSLTQTAVTRARDHLSQAGLSECIDVIGLGSLGRFEMSPESDLDSLIVCRADEEHDHAEDLTILDGLRTRLIDGVELAEPGSTGLFGGKIAQKELYEVIGLDRDTNPVHSRRVLVLEESVSLYDPAQHEDLLRKMVERYVDAIPLGRSNVPRFLVNDLARYWRQLAVDYQAKSETGSPSALRRLKLIVSRKFTYASSVLPLLTCDLRMIEKAEIVDRLVAVFQLPPTLRFLSELEYLGESGADKSAVSSGLEIMALVDQFNGLLTDPE